MSYKNNVGRFFSSTPQNRPIPGKENRMIENHAGGWSFKVSPEVMFRRWLLLGSEGGSYYQSEVELTLDNVKSFQHFAAHEPKRAVDIMREHLDKKWYLRPYPLMAAASYMTMSDDADVRSAAWEILKDLAYTPFNFFRILSYLKSMRGTGRSVRKFINWFYTSKSFKDFVYQTLKYRQRDGWTHRDALLLGHVKFEDSWQEYVRWLVENGKGNASVMEVPPVTKYAEGVRKLYEAVQNPDFFSRGARLEDVVKIVSNYGLTWDVIPSEFLKQPDIWKELIVNDLLPATAMLRQLPRITAVFDNDIPDEVMDRIEARLNNGYESGKFTFYQILRAYGIYRNGRSAQISFNPDRRIKDLLLNLMRRFFTDSGNDDSFEGKNVLVVVDESGSMSWSNMNGMYITPFNFAMLFASYLAHIVGSKKMVLFDTDYRWVSVPKTVDEALDFDADGGGTDLGLAIEAALDKAKEGAIYDMVAIFTDSETWAGHRHMDEYADEYRRRFNPNLKIVNVPLVANRLTTLDTENPLNLEVCGPVPELDRLLKVFIKI